VSAWKRRIVGHIVANRSKRGAELLSFSAITANALDTVGDRDFVLDWTWSGTRVLLALSRLSTDVIDFTTSEFAF